MVLLPLRPQVSGRQTPGPVQHEAFQPIPLRSVGLRAVTKWLFQFPSSWNYLVAKCRPKSCSRRFRNPSDIMS